MTDKPVTLAAITGAHGVTGEVRLKLLGEGLEALRPHKSFNGGALVLAKIRSDSKGGAIARFEGVADRSAAEKLRGVALTVPRSSLPDLSKDEYYHADLVGLRVVTDADCLVGIVRAIENFGATDIVEIERPDGKTFMVPMTKSAVIEWDHERMVISADFAED